MGKEPIMTVKDIQQKLKKYCADCRPVAPNIYFYVWESDFLAIRKSGFAEEFEIKLTKADFKADARKQKIGLTKYEWLSRGAGPTYFSYVVPEGLVLATEVPEFAGLYWVKGDLRYSIREVKKPRRLNKTKLTLEQLVDIYKSIYYRYFINKKQ